MWFVNLEILGKLLPPNLTLFCSAFDILKQIFVQIGSGNINLSSISYF